MTEMNKAIEQAMAALSSDNAENRAAAIETLGEHRHSPAVSQIIDIVKQADPGTRFIGVKALGLIADPSAVPVLLDALRWNDMWTRAAATGALISIGQESIDGLVSALRDENKNVRRAAAKAIGKIGETANDERVCRGLSAALLDVDQGVRRFAAEALGRLGAENMVSELKESLTDQNMDVRIAAFKALAQLDTPEASKAVHKWLHE